MATESLILGTRQSKLAMIQAELVKACLQQAFPDLEIHIHGMTTQGDESLHLDFAQLDKGMFTKTIETALLNGDIDVAVHSLKDLPTKLPNGLQLRAVLPREDSRDVFVSNEAGRLNELPPGTRIGTGSPRRRAQVLAYRNDLDVIPIRGNVDTRLTRLDSDEYDALILAAAGLKRLGLEHRITSYLEFDVMMPPPGQGPIGLEIRQSDQRIETFLDKINHTDTWYEVMAERSFLKTLGGGCHIPIASQAVCQLNQLNISGLVSNPDGQQMIRLQRSGSVADAELLGQQLANELLKKGAEALLNEQH